MNFATWNIQGIGTKKSEVLSELKKFKIDIAVLNETKKKGHGSEVAEDYVHYYSGVPKEDRAKARVSVLIRKRIARQIKSWKFVNEGIISLEIKLKGWEIVIIGVYAPTDDAKVQDKEKFYDNLTELMENISNRKEIFLNGDLNARTGCVENSAVVGIDMEKII